MTKTAEPIPLLHGTRDLVRSGTALRGGWRLARDLVDVVRGTDGHLPRPKDPRFADPAWTDNPVFRRLAQTYTAVTATAARALEALETEGVDWREVERARFLVTVLGSALSPTNIVASNPAVLKRAFDTGGRSLLSGLSNVLSDLVHNGGMPTQTDTGAYRVGEEMALTPGAVVERWPVAELLQYAPSTPQVHRRPVLIVPPPIGRFYFLDLRPGRSFVEHALAQGLQVFLLSWRNPGPEHADWDIDTYAGCVRDALKTVEDITGSPDVNTLGFCAGGILQSLVLNAQAAEGSADVHSASFAVTLLDFDEKAPLGAFSMPWLLELAGHLSGRNGVITARALSTVFSLMRPDDLVFNYVVRGWLMGEAPPAFDILAWNADGTNLPAGLHEQFLAVFRDNALRKDTGFRALGHAVDLSAVTVPTFVTGATTDHLTPWAGCYRTTQLLSGPSTFVLSNSGHVASLVNPPGNPKATYRVDGPASASPQDWLAGSQERRGSWWEHWSAWVKERSGDLQDAPTELGLPGRPPLGEAPGSYVVDELP